MDENNDINKEIAIRYIAENYAAQGESQNREYITSADMVRELQEMAEITVAGISNLMYNSGFRLEFIDGEPHWEVYTR